MRNANINAVGRILQQKSIRVGEMEAMKPDERTSSVQEIQDFLTKVCVHARAGRACMHVQENPRVVWVNTSEQLGPPLSTPQHTYMCSFIR